MRDYAVRGTFSIPAEEAYCPPFQLQLSVASHKRYPDARSYIRMKYAMQNSNHCPLSHPECGAHMASWPPNSVYRDETRPVRDLEDID
jgi:hypothetical protein